MDKTIYGEFTKLLHRELVPAMGCTEPIAIAYAGARARKVLGRMPEHCHVRCSGKRAAARTGGCKLNIAAPEEIYRQPVSILRSHQRRVRGGMRDCIYAL